MLPELAFAQVCLDFVSRNLAAVMKTDGYNHMTRSCPNLQAEILATIAATGPVAGHGNHERSHGHRQHGQVRIREHTTQCEEEGRRVRPRRE